MAKWWGPLNIRPIVCIHGRQDNAGSFDRLIPLLPRHIGYLVFDLPGHGFSTPFPSGTVYTDMSFCNILNYVFKRIFQWDKVSLVGHSLGSVISFYFASVFPNYVDIVIGIDSMVPSILTPSNVNWMNKWLDGHLKADEKNKDFENAPTFSHNDLIKKMVKSTGGSLTEDAVSFLFERGCRMAKNQNEKFRFYRDLRVKELILIFPWTQEINDILARRVICPYLFVRGADTPYSDKRTEYEASLKVMQENPKFQVINVKAGHHLHLTDPAECSSEMNAFIQKYRPSDSKL